MCTYKRKITDGEPRTGYKVAIKIDGRYFSICTGVEYQIGKPIAAPTTTFFRYAAEDIIAPTGSFYSAQHVGNTAVFQRFRPAEELFYSIHRVDHTAEFVSYISKILGYKPDSIHVVVVKMTLGSDLYYGVTDGYSTYCGNNILSIIETDRCATY